MYIFVSCQEKEGKIPTCTGAFRSEHAALYGFLWITEIKRTKRAHFVL